MDRLAGRGRGWVLVRSIQSKFEVDAISYVEESWFVPFLEIVLGQCKLVGE